MLSVIREFLSARAEYERTIRMPVFIPKKDFILKFYGSETMEKTVLKS